MMNIRSKLKDLINIPLGTLGYKLIANESNPNIYDRLKLYKTLGLSPRVIYDCGAFLGKWSQKVSKIFPHAQFILVEPNSVILDETRKNIQNIKSETILIEKGVGSNITNATLNIWSGNTKKMTSSSLLGHVVGEPKKKISIEVTTLDIIAVESGRRPDIVKLDLQGTELDALMGAKEILSETELFIVEFSCLEAYKNRTNPKELINFMYNHDYTLYDVVDLIYRPYDKALTGGDFIFVKTNSPLKAYKGSR